jgi:lysozyme family protein
MDVFKDIALPLVLVFEGMNFTNHPADKGGPTRYGIIQRVYDKYCLEKNKPLISVEKISVKDVEDIYCTKYWNPVRCKEMPEKLSVVVFDTTVNSGQGRAVKILQQTIDAKVDGIIGKETIEKILNNSKDKNKLANLFIDIREQFYNKIVAVDSTQKVFLKGWLRRAQFLRDYINEVKNLKQIKEQW